METKEHLVNNIKEWIKIDNELTQLRKLIKDKNVLKKNLTEDLMVVMKNNSIDCFDINDGSLVYKQSKVKKPINGKSLLNVLKDYYKNDPNLAEDLTKHIMENREEQIKETLKRKIIK